MALFEMAHFWSNLLAWGYQHNLPLYHAFVIDMILANGAEIPASSCERRGDGDFSSSAGPQALSENELKPLFALANSELRAKFAHGGRSEISKQGAKRCCEKMSDGGPKRFLAWSISLSYALKTKVRNLIDGTTS